MSDHFKTAISPPPPLLALWQDAAPRSRCFAIVALLSLLWLGLGAADWFMRFQWFGWQRAFIVRSATVSAAKPEAVIATNAPWRGGDLSRLIGISSVAAPFEEERPGATNYTDAAGFRNQPPILDRYPVVCVGDSYTATGPRFDETLPAQLSTSLGVPVYNHAVPGRGTFWATVCFFASERFLGSEPRVLVWPVIEREIAGRYFEGGLYQIFAAPTNVARAASLIDWTQFRPASLKRSLPNTSAFSQLSGRVWNRARYTIFRRLNPAVLPAAKSVCNGPMLFYSEAVNASRWSDKDRDLDHVINAASNLTVLARNRGMTLLFVLVPDKERVYSSALPPSAHIGSQPCILPDLESRMRKNGIAVVNLLPAFEAAAIRGELLFWRDDTHWNPAGVHLAAEMIAPEVKRLLAAP